MKVLVDTSVLCRLVQPEHELHKPVSAVVNGLLSDGYDLRIVPQVLYELWAIATRPVADNGMGLTVEKTVNIVDRIQRIFPVLSDESGIFQHWLNLVTTAELCGSAAHDAQIVAAMRRHQITHLLTLNVSDFRRYEGVTLIEVPAAV